MRYLKKNSEMMRKEEEKMRLDKRKLREAAKVAGKIALEIVLIIIFKRWKGGGLWK